MRLSSHASDQSNQPYQPLPLPPEEPMEPDGAALPLVALDGDEERASLLAHTQRSSRAPLLFSSASCSSSFPLDPSTTTITTSTAAMDSTTPSRVAEGTAAPPETAASAAAAAATAQQQRALLAARRWKSVTALAATQMLQAPRRRLHDTIDEMLQRHSPGAAPGVDPRRDGGGRYPHLAAKWCLPAQITVVDFDSKSLSIHSGLDSADKLSAFLELPRGGAGGGAGEGGAAAGAGNGGGEGGAAAVAAAAGGETAAGPEAGATGVGRSGSSSSSFPAGCAASPASVGSASAPSAAVGPQPQSQPQPQRGVRWIHVDGLNWDVIRVLALKYDLHPLALEDTVHVPQRIKADFYDSCLYMALIYLYLARSGGADGDGDGGNEADGTDAPAAAAAAPPRRAVLPRTISIVKKADAAAAAAAFRRGVAVSASSTAAAAAAATASSPSSSSSGAPIHVSSQQVSLFLLRGEAHPNTLITVFQSDGSEVTRPILDQLREPRTLVREAEDASFLANLVIDTLVDHLFPVVGCYREALLSYEAEVTGGRARDSGRGSSAGRSSKPPRERDSDAAASTRQLHAMQRELRRLDRTIAPLQAVVANMVSRDTPTSATSTAPTAATPPPPFLSPLTRTYLNDVRDHVATICEDLISLSYECGDLIGLIFNLATLAQAQSTQALAVVSTIFLPITFLAGVYGMNFDTLPELHWQYGYLYFWITSAAIVVLFGVAMRRAGMWGFVRQVSGRAATPPTNTHIQKGCM